MNIIPINEEDNVGDGLAKINYNFLKLNNDTCELLEAKKNNYLYLKKVENLMLWLDHVISYTDYDKLQKLETTIQMLSGYWNKYEFTVQYPFNPVNGFTSSLVDAGKLGGLQSFDKISSTSQEDQQNLIAEALVQQKLYDSVELAIKGLKDAELLYVIRDTNGNFQKWDFLNPDFIFNLSVDLGNNLYFDSTLIDVYKIPYYSALTTNKDFDLFQEKVFATFATKRLSVKGTIQPIDKTSLNNILIVYDDYQRIEEEVYEVETDEGDIVEQQIEIDVTTFTPEIVNLNSIIPQKNIFYKDKMSAINDDIINSSDSNPRLNKLALKYLNDNYNAVNYLDGTTVNVLFFLYNIVGYEKTGSALVRTDYYDQSDVSTPINKLELFNTNKLDLVAPSSNTTFSVYFSKKDTYVQRIINVKYIKQTDVVTRVDEVTGKVSSTENHYWEFKNATLGAHFQKNAGIITDLEAPDSSISNLTEFGTPPAPGYITDVTEYGGVDTPATAEDKKKNKNKKKKQKDNQKAKDKRAKEREQRQKRKEREKEKKQKEKERRENKKEKEKKQRENKAEKEKQKRQNQKNKDKTNNDNRKKTENNRKNEKTRKDNATKGKNNKQTKKNNNAGIKNNKNTEQTKKNNKNNKNSKDSAKKTNKDNQKSKTTKQKNDENKKASNQKKKQNKVDNAKKAKDNGNKKASGSGNNQKQKKQQNKPAGDSGTKKGNKVETKAQKKQQAAQQAHKASGGGGGGGKPKCFVSGTVVTLFNNEFINIQDVNIGSEVLTYNFDKKQNEMSVVSGIETSKETSFIKIVLESGKILLSTIMHPYYVYNTGLCTYNPSEYSKLFPNEQLTNKLKVGDVLIDSSKQKHTIISIEKIDCDETDVYNLYINGNQNYYANDILVGN